VNLLATAQHPFLSATTYSVNGGPAVAYTSAQHRRQRLARADLGYARDGERFTIQRMTGGAGDNRNGAPLGLGPPACECETCFAAATTSIRGALQRAGGAGRQ